MGNLRKGEKKRRAREKRYMKAWERIGTVVTEILVDLKKKMPVILSSNEAEDYTVHFMKQGPFDKVPQYLFGTQLKLKRYRLWFSSPS